MNPYAWRDLQFSCSKKATEFFHGQPGIVNDSAQGALRQLRMIGHREPSMGRNVEPENDVASALVIHLITDLRKRLHDLFLRRREA